MQSYLLINLMTNKTLYRLLYIFINLENINLLISLYETYAVGHFVLYFFLILQAELFFEG